LQADQRSGERLKTSDIYLFLYICCTDMMFAGSHRRRLRAAHHLLYSDAGRILCNGSVHRVFFLAQKSDTYAGKCLSGNICA
jgi:hypothetical protein